MIKTLISQFFTIEGEIVEVRIGVGRTDWIRSPLPPNRTCGSPASGSPVGGFTSERIDGPGHRLLGRSTAPAQQSRRWASGCGLGPETVLCAFDGGAGGYE